MKAYRPRIADGILARKLKGKGAVLIQGPKWCGKTTTAEQIAEITNESLAISPNFWNWFGLLMICFILPGVLTWAFGLVERKLGWIKDGDLTLPDTTPATSAATVKVTESAESQD